MLDLHGHILADQVVRYHRNLMEESELAPFKRHLMQCEDCIGLFEDIENATALPMEPAAPEE